MDLPFYREYELPWTTGRSQDKKFRRLLGIVFLVCGVLSVVWPFIPVPEPDPYDIEEIPEDIQKELKAEPVPFDDLLENSDIVSMHVPLTRRTRGMMSDREFRQVPEIEVPPPLALLGGAVTLYARPTPLPCSVSRRHPGRIA